MAELLALYPDTPVAPDALYHLARTLEKQGKKILGCPGFHSIKDILSPYQIFGAGEQRTEESASVRRY
jgi:hypothetical protein